MFLFQISEPLGFRHAGKFQFFFHILSKPEDLGHDIKMGEGDMISERRLQVLKRFGQRIYNSAIAEPILLQGVLPPSGSEDLGKCSHIFVRHARERIGIREDGLAAIQHLLTELFLVFQAHLV